ncbi:hypothetical protein ACQEU8_33475 [Streptomyces sp. CA-250714]|uniref:hypothetical protein n=1 Tax=Streptomyces sp. CA-250714 TaxID=3240060 RepID=UPI003D8B781B
MRLCASLLIVVIILVAAIVLLPAASPSGENIPGTWAAVLSAGLSLVGLSCRSYLRIVRFRRG